MTNPQKKFFINKAFFGKINCFKILMNDQKEIYFHLGLLNEKEKKWTWNKCKMSDIELGEIINLLSQTTGKCSFFHSYGNDKTQIWCQKDEKKFSIKINDISKNLTVGEFEVLKLLLETCIRRQNQ